MIKSQIHSQTLPILQNHLIHPKINKLICKES